MTHEFGLLVFMRNLRGALLRWRCFAWAGRRAPSHEFISHEFTLSFMYLEDRTVNSPIAVNIFQGQRVVFFVSKETNDSSTSERSRSFPDLHWRSADLLALAAQKLALNRCDLYLCAGLSILLKSQRIVFN